MQNAQHIASSHALSDDSLSSSRNVPRPIAPMPLPPPAQKQQPPYHRGAPPTLSMDVPPNASVGAASSILKPKQKRYRANPDQLRHLINLFNINPSPTASELTNLSVRINMPTQSVILWFKNRRARVPHKKAEKERRAAVAKAEKVSAATGTASVAAQTANVQAGTAIATERVHSIINSSTSSAVDTAAAIVLADMASSHRRNTNTSTNEGNANGNSSMPRDLAMLCSAAAVQQQHITRLPPLPPPLPPIGNGNSNGNSNINSEAKRNGPTNIPAPAQYPLVPALPGGIRLTVPGNYYINSNLVANTGTTRSSLLPTPPPPSQALTATTPRRPRGVHYSAGESVEVLINDSANDGNTMGSEDKDRVWMPATIVNKCSSDDPKELHLGASIVNHSSDAQKQGAVSSASSSDAERDSDDERNSNTESPRTVQSPAASGSGNSAAGRKLKKYTVKLLHNSREEEMPMAAARIRPVPPMIEWSNLQPEDAVEVEIEGGWKVGTMKEYNSSKNKWGVLVDNRLEYMRKDQLRAHQVWRGGNEWVQKTRIPPIRRIEKEDSGKNKENILLGKRSAATNANANVGEGMETRRKRLRKK